MKQQLIAFVLDVMPSFITQTAVHPAKAKGGSCELNVKVRPMIQDQVRAELQPVDGFQVCAVETLNPWASL